MDLDLIQTKLGRWLAENISTTFGFTFRSREASQVKVVLPTTEVDLLMEEIVRSIRVHCGRPLVDQIDVVREALLRVEKIARFSGTKRFDQLQSYFYEWPVYGSYRLSASTPEEYFDACAREIRMTGGVVAWAGAHRAELPQSLVRTMAGGGDRLLRRWREEQAVSRPAFAAPSSY